MMCEDRKLNIHYLIDAQKFYITVSLHPGFYFDPSHPCFLLYSLSWRKSTLYPEETDTTIMKSQIFHRLPVLNPEQKPRILLG